MPMAMGSRPYIRSNSPKDYETPSMEERRDSTKDSTDDSSDSGTIYYATGDFTPLEDNQVRTWCIELACLCCCFFVRTVTAFMSY